MPPHFEVPGAEFDKYEESLETRIRYTSTGLKYNNLLFMFGIYVVRGAKRTAVPKFIGPARRQICERVWAAIQGGAKPRFDDALATLKLLELAK